MPNTAGAGAWGVDSDSERTGKQIERKLGLQPEDWRAPTRELEGSNPRTGGHQPRRTGERAPTPWNWREGTNPVELERGATENGTLNSAGAIPSN